MADHSKPTNSSTYSNYTSQLDARMDDLALGLDPANTTVTNQPTNAIRWYSAGNKWQKWNGSSWADLSATYDINVVAPTTHAATGKTTPVDADEIPLVDSAASNALKKLTWANLKAAIKTYIEGVTFSLLKVGGGTAASPSLLINSTDTGFYQASSGIAWSIGGFQHGYISSVGQLVYPATNVLAMGSISQIEVHQQSVTNTATAGGTTYGSVFNYTVAPANLITTHISVLSQGSFNGPAGTVANLYAYSSAPSLGASNLSDVTNLVGYNAGNATIGGGSVTNKIGFKASDLSGATNHYGFKGEVSAAANKWNLYLSGTAINYMNGNLLLGTTTDDGLNQLQVSGSASFTGGITRGAPVTKTANFSVGVSESWLICNKGSSLTVTLPSAATYPGREIMIKTIQAFTVISASSNVVPIDSATAGTAILPATDGAWATLVSDGTNWIVMQKG